MRLPWVLRRRARHGAARRARRSAAARSRPDVARAPPPRARVGRRSRLRGHGRAPGALPLASIAPGLLARNDPPAESASGDVAGQRKNSGECIVVTAAAPPTSGAGLGPQASPLRSPQLPCRVLSAGVATARVSPCDHFATRQVRRGSRALPWITRRRPARWRSGRAQSCVPGLNRTCRWRRTLRGRRVWAVTKRCVVT